MLLAYYCVAILGMAAASNDCEYKEFHNAVLRTSPNSLLHKTRIHNSSVACKQCDMSALCKAISQIGHQGIKFYYSRNYDHSLGYDANATCKVWMKMCGQTQNFKLIDIPNGEGYFEPIEQETAVSSIVALRDDTKMQSAPASSIGLPVTGEVHSLMARNSGFKLSIKELPLPNNLYTESLLESICTKGTCLLSPRTYFHPVTEDYSLVGFSDKKGMGNIFILGQDKSPYQQIVTTVEGSPAIIAGVYGFHDKSFAVSLFVNSTTIQDRKLYLRYYRSDLTIEWTTLLNSPISVPERNVGDFRLSYGSGYFITYFSVFGVSNFAEGVHGEQLSFVNEQGKLQSTSFSIPGQNFVHSGDAWVCANGLGQLVSYHSKDGQFVTVCSADKFPEGISLGDSTAGTLVFKADVDGKGSTSAQLGQIAESDSGFKLVFNAEDAECCPAKGVGFISIYNEENNFKGGQEFDRVVWLNKSSTGKSERDPVIARIILSGTVEEAPERYLVGWRDEEDEEYKVVVLNTFGKYRQPPISVSSFLFDGAPPCGHHCVMWGNRDDSFKTLPNGHVGWIYAPPTSSSIWLYDVGAEDEEYSLQGWSLWSGWSFCSQSCGGGITTRRRTCLTSACELGDGEQQQLCNTHDCTIPVTCSFNYTDNHDLEGGLIINGVQLFEFTQSSAEDRCKELRDLCSGITQTLRNGNIFYFLKTSSVLQSRADSRSGVMQCRETPGWSVWSSWYACTTSCGSGERNRLRYCDGAEVGSDLCLGNTEETQLCNLGSCPAWFTWSKWSSCSASCNEGSQSRSRKCTGDFPLKCQSLSGPNEEQRTCFLGVCPQWSPWTMWTGCTVTCGDGFQERTRKCSGDFVCPLEDGIGDTEGRECTVGVCPYWTNWGKWSGCGESCGESTRARSRQCLGDYSSETGCPLLGDAREIESCNLGECPHWSDWNTWSSCLTSCGNSTRMRTRQCLGDFPLQFCENLGSSDEAEECNLGECALFDDWQSWGECSASCGEGIQTRIRECRGDFLCPEGQPITINTGCNLGVCPSWSNWGPWGPCTNTCGLGGSRTRTRQCLGDFPHLCDSEGFTESSVCEGLSECPRWNNWMEWGSCSVTCDFGVLTRSRTCKADIFETCDVGAEDTDADIEPGRKVTTEQNLLGHFVQTESRNCSDGLCSYWLEWMTWGVCSATCDEGSRTRTRECFGDFPFICFSSGKSSETETCTRGRCGTWGKWSSWGQCSATCGGGVWTRSRQCLGDFAETCIGQANETASCDINDCVEQCTPSPCNNGGNCRANVHLNRLYHCNCPSGWIGKHCDYLGPDLLCGSDNILVSFNEKLVSDEGLLTDDPTLVGLESRDDLECTALFDQHNATNYYLIITPSPIDSACGSTMEITPTSYRIRNQVTWQIEDVGIRSTVILIDFTCIYLRNATASSDDSSLGPLSVESYKRQVEVATSSGLFEVDISLYRDPLFNIEIRIGGGSPFVDLAEGEVVFVSVELRSRDLLPSGNAVLVMDTCFVTSSQSNRQPIVYLVQESCPSTPFVTILSNGESRFGRFSVRIFGWTGTDTTVQGAYIHCTVSVCDNADASCIPKCDSRTTRRKRSYGDAGQISYNSYRQQQVIQQSKILKAKNSQNTTTTSKVGLRSFNGYPYMSITQVVPPSASGKARIDLSHSASKFDPEKMVSVGPFEIVLKINQRHTRNVAMNEPSTPANLFSSSFLFLAAFGLLAAVALLLSCSNYTKLY